MAQEAMNFCLGAWQGKYASLNVIEQEGAGPYGGIRVVCGAGSPDSGLSSG